MGKVHNDARIYSADKKLWVGMTYEQAYKYKKMFEAFNFANKNGDDHIDEKEMRRYNGPLLIVEKDDKTKQRFIGHYAGVTGPFSSRGSVAGDIITSKEFEFYPGQKYEEVNEKDFNLAYRDLDCTPSDRTLSKEEIQKYQAYVERKNEYKQKYAKLKAQNHDTTEKNSIKRAAGTVLGAVAGFFGGALAGSQVERILANSRKLSDFSFSAGSWTFAASIAGVAVLGYLAGKAFDKETIPPEKLEKEYSDLKPLDEKYKHVYNQ